MTTSVVRPPTRKGAATRARLLRAAKFVFERKGLPQRPGLGHHDQSQDLLRHLLPLLRFEGSHLPGVGRTRGGSSDVAPVRTTMVGEPTRRTHGGGAHQGGQPSLPRALPGAGRDHGCDRTGVALRRSGQRGAGGHPTPFCRTCRACLSTAPAGGDGGRRARPGRCGRCTRRHGRALRRALVGPGLSGLRLRRGGRTAQPALGQCIADSDRRHHPPETGVVHEHHGRTAPASGR